MSHECHLLVASGCAEGVPIWLPKRKACTKVAAGSCRPKSGFLSFVYTSYWSQYVLSAPDLCARSPCSAATRTHTAENVHPAQEHGWPRLSRIMAAAKRPFLARPDAVKRNFDLGALACNLDAICWLRRNALRACQPGCLSAGHAPKQPRRVADQKRFFVCVVWCRHREIKSRSSI